jgi:hypothetical protein
MQDMQDMQDIVSGSKLCNKAPAHMTDASVERMVQPPEAPRDSWA